MTQRQPFKVLGATLLHLVGLGSFIADGGIHNVCRSRHIRSMKGRVRDPRSNSAAGKRAKPGAQPTLRCRWPCDSRGRPSVTN